MRSSAKVPAVQAAESSLSSASSACSDGEMPASPTHLGAAEVMQQRHAVVIDHQGAGKVMHKPDGTVVWEPAPQSNGDAAGGRFNNGRTVLQDVALATGVGMVGLPAYIGLMSALVSADAAAKLTATELAGLVAHNVSGYVAGTVAGVIMGPLLAARLVVGVAARPALLFAVARAGVGAWRRWGGGVACLLRKLHSPDAARVLEALRAIIAAASRGSPRFAREFNRLKGMEALLSKLADALPDCPLLHLIAQALAELCKDQECRESLVAAGGVPRLVSLLQSPNPAVSVHGLAALGLLADNALAVEAIREAGGLTRLVELTAAAVAPTPAPAVSLTTPAAGGAASAAASAAPTAAAAAAKRATLMPAVKLLQALSLDPAGKAAIGAAGGVAALLEVVARSEPRSEAQSAAIGALHNALRGCPENQRALAALPAASEVLRGALAGYGPCWQPAKGDLHALLNVLSRLQGVQEAGGFVVIQSQAAAAAPALPQPRDAASGAAAATRV
ncbi:hypothetical protein GPECTOR_6g832 [Gonium pectorale]|uniref:Armadillo repeat-containing domain-containing protein n=1 Tax=Gonium pectorale TaxID=33097 RepID=A0A150GVT8_GONPE|nr:hypothetical protein GPECTOR_6g832 [Gonium pectorale]|eukprot:KXZ53914.1 hypothetical protein GPECTOR_6g832 [Gonium pectorale]